MNEITQHDFGLLRREVKDARAIASNIDYKLTRLLDSDEPDRDGRWWRGLRAPGCLRKSSAGNRPR